MTAAAKAKGPSTELDAVIAAYQRWLFLPDKAPLYAVLGTVAANLLPGDPTWLMLVGAPGSGKSETLLPLAALPFVHPTGTLTEASLLSGTSAKERAKSSKGGLLKEIGKFGIVVTKDFGSILSQHPDTRAQLLAALREVYDGSWTRHVGTDGGRTLTWEGKLGFIGACTQAIDKHHSVMGSMGERFLLLRLPPVDEDRHAVIALTHSGREREMRAELAAAVAELFETIKDAAGAPELTAAESSMLVTLSTFVVRSRSSVDRDRTSREIEFVPDAEAPGRLVQVLRRLLDGLTVIGLNRDDAWTIVRRVGLDSIPPTRLRCIEILAGTGGQKGTTEIATTLDLPTITVRRALEELTAHKIATRYSQGAGKADSWTLTTRWRDRYATITGTVSAKSEGMGNTTNGSHPNTPVNLFSQELNDIAEKVSQ